MVTIKDGKYVIEYKGKFIVTNYYNEVSNDIYDMIYSEYYKKPTIYEVHKNLKHVHNGSTAVPKIVNYYFKDLMSKVKLYTKKWTIEEILESKDLLGFFIAKINKFTNVYPKDVRLIKNFETALRIGSSGIAGKPSNFPMKTIDDILETYNINNNYYDFSCGWGIRLLSAMKNKVNYYGTDPNYLLIERLNCLTADYKQINNTKTIVDIRCLGSEIFIPEWTNTIGVAFSSPPYFNLEDYKIGNQSYKEGTEYKDWLNNYLKPTLQNIMNYLVVDGYFLINIKDYNNIPLCKDTKIIAEQIGFNYIESIPLKNMKRPALKNGLNADEDIMVFKKIKQF